MRLFLAVAASALCLQSSPAAAWQAGAEGRLCTLEHDEAGISVRLTYDATGPEYTISITRAEPWPRAPVFALTFVGARGNQIATTRHALSADSRTLTVADTGFGNVLDGLARNAMAIAQTGEANVPIDLTGARPEVEAFRTCGAAPAV